MTHGLNIPVFEMVMCVANAVDLVSPYVHDHHKRTAFIAANIASELGLEVPERRDVALAGLLHDIGALSLKDRLDALEFEVAYPRTHAERGYRLLSGFGPFAGMSRIVRYHHVDWNDGYGGELYGEPVPQASQILHLADRVDVLLDWEGNVLEQVDGIVDKISRRSPSMFVPGLVDVFRSLSARESFWLEAADTGSLTSGIREGLEEEAVKLDTSGLLEIAGLFSRVIDFRSRYTAVHSSGVAASAEALAGLSGMPAGKMKMVRLAGYLHDLGKLAVPAEILEKPAKLSSAEFSVIKSHTFYTNRVLGDVGALEEVNAWASYHHERLDGRGYPFHRSAEQLCLGSRVMSVADVFTALSETRPYRGGMEKQKVLRIMGRMAADNALDGELVVLLEHNYADMEESRRAAQREAMVRYESFNSPLYEDEAA